MQMGLNVKQTRGIKLKGPHVRRERKQGNLRPTCPVI